MVKQGFADVHMYFGVWRVFDGSGQGGYVIQANSRQASNEHTHARPSRVSVKIWDGSLLVSYVGIAAVHTEWV